MSEHKHTNALAKETSPYLLQHAHNPVDWYPWGEEALSKAKKEDKPILLSIGYSACHWCHVMEHESFENEEIAKLMNEHFVNIKVDREERPDLDSIYMNVVQMMTGSGGWPMTVFLSPEQVPFYCGTYFPPEEGYGRPSFRRVLTAVAQTYREKRQTLNDSAKTILAELRKSNALSNARGELKDAMLEKAASGITANYDSRNGGFGGAPKFPPSMTLSYLMQSHRRNGELKYLGVVNQTLTKMACGGIYDQIGGGFHRYSVDAEWLVPHFEKMLYDNALLSRVYLDGFLLTKNALYRRICQETLDYVMREMTSAEGGFYSSQDADSEDKEGAFFIWSADEVKSLLAGEESELFCRYYGITGDGNFEGQNILNVPKSIDSVAELNGIPADRLLEIIHHGRKVLFEARETRIKPARDEKVLTAWNGMMMRSFAEAANALDRDDYRQVAVQNGEFILSKLRRKGRLLRSYKDAQAKFNAYLEDYACLIDGLISLYEATFDPGWIRAAEELAGRMIQLFGDLEGGIFYFTSEDHESLIHRPKDFYDNATPSGNSVAVGALFKLWKLTGDDKWCRPAVKALESMSALLEQYPAAVPQLLCGLDFYLGKTKEIAIIGDPAAPDTRELLRVIFQRYLPNKVVACGETGGLFLLEDKAKLDNLAAAYVCEEFTCATPVNSAEGLIKLLE
jgi:uncharacterized protein YyaL (SSP411 family)